MRGKSEYKYFKDSERTIGKALRVFDRGSISLFGISNFEIAGYAASFDLATYARNQGWTYVDDIKWIEYFHSHHEKIEKFLYSMQRFAETSADLDVMAIVAEALCNGGTQNVWRWISRSIIQILMGKRWLTYSGRKMNLNT